MLRRGGPPIFFIVSPKNWYIGVFSGVEHESGGTIPVCTTSKFFADFRFTDSENQFLLVVFGHADFEYAIIFVI